MNLAPRIGPRRAAGADAGLAAEGLWSIELRSEGATHTGGLRQRVAVDPGTILSASAWAFSQASNGEPGARSEPPGTYAVSLGVDPRGGEDPDGAGVRWTAPVTVTDAWLPLALEAVAEGHAVTLFTRGQALRILRRNLARWDAICLRAVGRVGEPAWPAPRPPRRAPTAGPGAPAPTRDPLVAAAVATRLHDGLEAAAAARGAPGAMSVGAGATLAAHATRIAAGPPTPDYDAWTADPPPGAALAERAGWIALALVAFVVGVLAGLGRVAS